MGERKSTHDSGMAGEFYVMEALYRLGHQPALTLGNAKTVDILVHLQSGKTVRISVKTVRGGGKWGVGKDDFSRQSDLFFVFLLYNNFTDVTVRPEVFIVSADNVQRFKEPWLESFAVYYSNKDKLKRLEPFRNAWNLIDQGYA